MQSVRAAASLCGSRLPKLYHAAVFVQELGINCIELMPCHEFNELEYYSYNSAMGDYKY